MNRIIKYFNLKYFCLLVAILYLARPATLFSNIDPRINLFGFLLYLVPHIVLAIQHRVKYRKRFFAIMAVYSSWIFIHHFTDETFKVLAYFICYLHIYVAYVLVRVFGKKLFSYFWRIVTFLAAIDLFLWLGINGVDPNLLAKISILTPASDTSSASFIIFNSRSARYDGMGVLGLQRNCGFAWEPGLFGSILILALLFNISEKGFVKKNSLSLCILFLSIFSTFSTTTYTAVFFILVLHLFFSLFNKFSYKRLWIIVGMLSSFWLIKDLPFMNEKIQEDIKLENTFSDDKRVLSEIEDSETLYTAQRTEGLLLDYLNFKDSPFFGYGFHWGNSYVANNISSQLITSNDLTSFLAKWGLIYAAFFLALMIRNSRYLRQIRICKDNSLLLVYGVIAVSYSLSLCALGIAFLFYQILERNKKSVSCSRERSMKYNKRRILVYTRNE